ncbi:hypothetical protein LVB77_08150 [Lysobacter sp. 5GHs7-4]|nr:hypothetical protein [Lysobacter sp. 5GHs7-4]UHQ24647.1 hypothetical protein LVB77_08150 [Lysobacter sp. 5GHs7-4]
MLHIVKLIERRYPRQGDGRSAPAARLTTVALLALSAAALMAGVLLQLR